MTRTTLLAGGLALLLPAFGQGDAAYQAVVEGNALYQAGQYPAALEQYDIAAEAAPDAAEVRFNQGDAWYQQFEFEQAVEHYTAAISTATPAVASRASYNIGVVHYRQAIQSLQTFQDALSLTESAIGHYRDSIRLDPGRSDARYNLELAYRLRQRIEAQKAQAQRHAETRNQETSENRGQSFDEEARADEGGRRDAQPDANQQPRGRQAQEAPPNNVASDNTTQLREAKAPPEMTPQAAEELLEILRDRARAAESQRQQQRRSRIHDAAVDKNW